MCVTMGSGVLVLRLRTGGADVCVHGCSTSDTISPTGIAQVLASIVTSDINCVAEKRN